jgi:hypothetical protein
LLSSTIISVFSCNICFVFLILQLVDLKLWSNVSRRLRSGWPYICVCNFRKITQSKQSPIRPIWSPWLVYKIWSPWLVTLTGHPIWSPCKPIWSPCKPIWSHCKPIWSHCKPIWSHCNLVTQIWSHKSGHPANQSGHPANQSGHPANQSGHPIWSPWLEHKKEGSSVKNNQKQLFSVCGTQSAYFL